MRWGLGQVFLASRHCAIDCPIVHLRETFSSELLIVNNWYWRWKWLNIFGLQEAWIIHIFHVKLPFVYSEKIGNVCCSPYKLVGFHWVHQETQCVWWRWWWIWWSKDISLMMLVVENKVKKPVACASWLLHFYILSTRSVTYNYICSKTYLYHWLLEMLVQIFRCSEHQTNWNLLEQSCP